MRSHGKGVVACCALLLSSGADAGILDWIREYDLNNYALGAAVVVSESEFTNADNSVWAYPYLTSFRNAAFTDDWLLLADGNVGLRWVSESGWVLGAVARINTGGLGSGDPEELRGLLERNWTVEAGPLVGYRAWPVHFQLKAYGDLLDRHNGTAAQFSLLLPWEGRRGYFVPSIDATWHSDEFNNYYYGVTEPESRPGRPEYVASADFDYSVTLRYGYELTPKWLLSGKVRMRWLGDEIRNSPIVDKDNTWSVNVGLAYNADVFNPRDFPYEEKKPRWTLRVGAFFDNVSTDIQPRNSEGIPGQIIDLENALGIPDDRVALQGELFWRVAHYHRFELGYFELGRNSSAVLVEPLMFPAGDDIPAGATVAVSTRFSTLFATYSYSFMRDAQKELGLTAGLHHTKFRTNFSADTGQQEKVSGETTLPVIGLHGSVSIGQKWLLAARAQFFGAEFDHYEGTLIYGSLELSRLMGENTALGFAYSLYSMDLTSNRSDILGTYNIQHYGPTLFASIGF